MKVSVIIPVYRDWTRLALCLDALEKQAYPSNQFEILVVNNDPSTQVPDWFEIPKNCTLLEEEQPGSYAARNRGLEAAQGELYCFTDADCRPSAGWLEEIVGVFERKPEVDIIGGEIRLEASFSSNNPAELYELIYSLKQEDYVGQNWAATANMGARKSVFDAVGTFDAGLFSNGDYEWCQRVGAAGRKITYCREAFVLHPARSTINLILMKFRRIVGGQVARKIKKIGYLRCLILFIVTFPFKVLPPTSGLTRLNSERRIGLAMRMRIYGLLYLIKITKTIERGRLLLFRSEPNRA